MANKIDIHYCTGCRWRLRDQIDPERSLGHSDTHSGGTR